ncbi:MAG: haloacid dehalogenase [Actinomycetota bacterium]|nr:haloacid dehalogenase [Actinomycetota bacterium]
MPAGCLDSRRQVITFDLFSALLDSASGAEPVLSTFGYERNWSRTGQQVYTAWDARNKELQKSCTEWTSFSVLAGQALADTYEHYGLSGDARQDNIRLLASVPNWPVWPDVVAGLTLLGRRFTLGILSNVDNDLLATTRIWALVDHEFAFTSERLGCYKPNPRIYQLTAAACPLAAHVAASARDVRGAVEAAIPAVRVARSGHRVDPAGPAPQVTVSTISELDLILARN